MMCQTNKKLITVTVTGLNEEFAKVTAKQPINEKLQSVGEPPMKKERLDDGMYSTSKMKKLKML
jgi:hypothetical protein